MATPSARLRPRMVRRGGTGEILRLESGRPHGHGGEAIVVRVPEAPDLVAKLYHQDRLSPRACAEREAKVRAMLAAAPASGGPRPAVAWPVDLLHDAHSGAFVGFLMPRVAGGLLWHQLADPIDRLRRAPGASVDFLLAAAANLCDAVTAVHAAGHVVGDVNPNNALVHRNALVTLVDADSFQIATPGAHFACPAGMPPYVAPEVVAAAGPRGDYAAVTRTPASDAWGVAILLHELLTGGADPTVTLAYASAPHTIVGPHPADALSPALRTLIGRCFGAGRGTPPARPSLAEWAHACRAAAQELVTCPAASSHRYGHHLPRCPHCASRHATGIDLYPEPTVVRSGRQLEPYGWRASAGQPRSQAAGRAVTRSAARAMTQALAPSSARQVPNRAATAKASTGAAATPPTRAAAPRTGLLRPPGAARTRRPAPSWFQRVRPQRGALTVAVMLLVMLAVLQAAYPPEQTPTLCLAGAAALAAFRATLRPGARGRRTLAVLALVVSAGLALSGMGEGQRLTRQSWQPVAELAWAARVPAPLAARLGEPRGVALARAELAAGDTSRALELLAHTLETRPDAAAAHALTGRIAFQQRRLRAAQVALTRAVDLSQWDPTSSPESLLLLARTVCRRGDADLGMRLLRHARRRLGDASLASITVAVGECGTRDRPVRRRARAPRRPRR